MKIIPVLKVLKPMVETAAHLMAASQATRNDARPLAEEVEILEGLAVEQASLSNDLAARVKELADSARELLDTNEELERRLALLETRLETLNVRWSWTFGGMLFFGSLALTAIVLVLTRGG